MAEQNKTSASLDLLLMVCWVGGLILAILVIVALSGEEGRLRYTSGGFLRWISQVLLPVGVLVVPRALGLTIVKQFNQAISRKVVYWIAICISFIFVGFT